MIRSDQKVAILLHGGILGVQGKTGLAMLRFSEAPIVAVIDRDAAGKSLAALTGIPRSVPIVASVAEALTHQPDVLAIGIAPSGGSLPEEWRGEIRTAIAGGLSIVNGLHTRLNADLEFTTRLQSGQWIWDVRQEPVGLKVGSGAARQLDCLRVLTVGTDMSVGKMSTSLELDRASKSRGLRSKFLATGQAGIMISGGGIPLDAVRVDFAAGAVEQWVLQAAAGDPPPEILHIEGQGSLLNPASTATLPLLRGTQPTHLILVHRAGQTHIRTFPHVPIPPLGNVVSVYESIAAAGGAFAPVKVVAIALNTGHLDAAAAQAAIEQVAIDTGLPCADPVRQGASSLLDAVLADAVLRP
jgi:uncharacterized NAD-dependent epimerase/dehydratase family protein